MIKGYRVYFQNESCQLVYTQCFYAHSSEEAMMLARLANFNRIPEVAIEL